MPTMAILGVMIPLLTGCLGTGGAENEISYMPRDLGVRDRALAPSGPGKILSIGQLRSGNKAFGGVSGMVVEQQMVTAITDVGQWLRFRLETDSEGRPQAVSNLGIGALGGLAKGKEDRDAEDLVRCPDGWLVSFERHHRVLSYDHGLSGTPRSLDMPADFADQPDNGGVEAITSLAGGDLLMFSEEAQAADGSGKGWIGRPGDWRPVRYARYDDFHPTAVRQMPDGNILVAQRRYTFLDGAALRLVVLDLADLRAGRVAEEREILRLQSPFLVDNFEAMSLATRADGRIVAYLISDDNFSPLQATLLLAVLLPS